jgi:hypothetical protein
MPSEQVLVAIAIRATLVILATDNLRLAFGSYRIHRDARALRGFIAGITMLGGAIAFGASSAVIREELPALDSAFRIATAAGVLVFVAGLLFSRISWRYPR